MAQSPPTRKTVSSAATTSTEQPALRRRAQILRSLITYHQQVADAATVTDLIAECLHVTTESNLAHQRDALVRQAT
jgi:hypothetical protein